MRQRGMRRQLRAMSTELDLVRARAERVAEAEERVQIAEELLRPGPARPGVAQIERLVAEARADGLPVTLHVEGEPRRLPPPVDASAFRIVYEALSNVRKHADDAPASVRVIWRAEALGLQVRDTGTRSGEATGEGRGSPTCGRGRSCTAVSCGRGAPERRVRGGGEAPAVKRGDRVAIWLPNCPRWVKLGSPRRPSARW